MAAHACAKERSRTAHVECLACVPSQSYCLGTGGPCHRRISDFALGGTGCAKTATTRCALTKPGCTATLGPTNFSFCWRLCWTHGGCRGCNGRSTPCGCDAAFCRGRPRWWLFQGGLSRSATRSAHHGGIHGLGWIHGLGCRMVESSPHRLVAPSATTSIIVR